MVLDQVAMCFRGNLLPVILMTLAITACLPCGFSVPGGENGTVVASMFIKEQPPSVL